MSQQALKNGDWVALRQILMRLGPTSLPTYLGLTASRLLGTNATKQLESKDLNDFVTGTPNRVTVASDGAGGVTLSTPQDINTDSDVTFNVLTLTGLQISAQTITGTASITTGASYELDTTSGDFTVTLPALAGAGRVLMFSCSGGNIGTLDGSGVETINGDTTFDLYEDESLILVDFGTEWRVF